MKFYKGIDTDFMGTFTELDSLKISNGPIAAHGVNLNDNDSLELVIGEQSGGLITFKLDSAEFHRDPYEDVNGISKMNVLDPDFNIYPNPSNGNFHIRFTANIAGYGIISIYDLSGKEVLKQNTNFSVRQEDISIQSSHLKQGVYIVTIELNKTLYRRKLIIQ